MSKTKTKIKIVYLYLTFIYFTTQFDVFTTISASENDQSIIFSLFFKEKLNNVPI